MSSNMKSVPDPTSQPNNGTRPVIKRILVHFEQKVAYSISGY